jgi:hypothetical protein
MSLIQKTYSLARRCAETIILSRSSLRKDDRFEQENYIKNGGSKPSKFLTREAAVFSST